MSFRTATQVVTAMGRELLGFIWAIGVKVEAPQKETYDGREPRQTLPAPTSAWEQTAAEDHRRFEKYYWEEGA